jgi:hypothetical protein
VHLPHAWSLTLLLFIGDRASVSLVADATTLEAVPVIRRPYVTPRAYTLPELVRIREVYTATLQSGRPEAHIATELAVELGRTMNSVRKRFLKLRYEADGAEQSLRYPAHSVTPVINLRTSEGHTLSVAAILHEASREVCARRLSLEQAVRCVHECTGMNRDVVRSNLAVLRSTTSVICP